MNTRDVQVIGVFDELIETTESQMGVTGSEFGAEAQKVTGVVEGLLRTKIEPGVEVGGEMYDLTDEMVSYRTESLKHVNSVDFEGGTIYVDTGLTNDIESEGYARDVIRRIQEMRKQLNPDVETEIDVSLDVDDERVADFVEKNSDLIAEETRAREFDLGGAEDETVEARDVENVSVTIAVTQLSWGDRTFPSLPGRRRRLTAATTRETEGAYHRFFTDGDRLDFRLTNTFGFIEHKGR